MNRIFLAAALATGLAGLTSSAAPLPVGTISQDVGYSEAESFNGSNYRQLTQRHLTDHPDTVLGLIYATPW